MIWCSMALQPLPTANMPTLEDNKAASPFPFAAMGASSSAEAQAVMTPLHATPADDEKQRMAELEKMLDEAQSRAAMIEQEAYDKAYAAGEKSGLALGEKRAEQIVQGLQEVLHHAELELQALQQQSVDAVLDICEAVLTHVMASHDQGLWQAMQTLVREASLQLGQHAHVPLTLLVHPQDLAMFEKMEGIMDTLPIQTQADVQQGTCRLVSAEQDVLIDPKNMVRQSLAHIKTRLTQASSAS